MVKLDVSLLRFMEDEDFRVLTALEMAMRNHDVAPTALVERIAQLPHGGCRKRLNGLLKQKIIHHENTMYDGYAMKYGAYDYLALRTMCKRGTCTAVGHRIGCGKESDIILVEDDAGTNCVLKLQRLGRCSFRSVTRNRDYKGNGRTRHGESWFYLSRLASQKEFAFMQALYDEGFPVPKPIDQNRHALLMELVPGTLLNNILVLGDPNKVYRRCLDLMVKLGEAGVIHGDFNEFNLMITDDQHVVVIDFPQMVSINHRNAADLFRRDVENLANFFQRRFRVTTLLYPTLEDDVVRKGDLDRRIFASGHFTRRHQKDLERLMAEASSASAEHDVASEDDEEDEEEAADAADAGSDGKAAKVNIPLPSSAETEGAPRLERADDEAHEDEESSEASLDEAVEVARHHRHALAADDNNENYLPDGAINEAHVKKQIRKNIRRRDNRAFDHALHRNTQKGRQKQKIQRQIKNAGKNGFFD